MARRGLLVVFVLCLLSSLVLSCSDDDKSSSKNNKRNGKNVPQSDVNTNTNTNTNSGSNTSTPFQLTSLEGKVNFSGHYDTSFVENKLNKLIKMSWSFQSDNIQHQTYEKFETEDVTSQREMKIDTTWKILKITSTGNTNEYTVEVSRTSASMTFYSKSALSAWNILNPEYKATLYTPLDITDYLIEENTPTEQTYILMFSEDKNTIQTKASENDKTVTFNYVAY